jgi:hypothetical protein
MGSCEIFGTDLEEPYVQSAKCEFFTTSTDPAVVAAAKKKAEAERKKIKETLKRPLTVEELIAELSRRGQTLTYFCCHCGAALNVGANQEVLKECPRCKYDLTIVDMAGLIRQHL